MAVDFTGRFCGALPVHALQVAFLHALVALIQMHGAGKDLLGAGNTLLECRELFQKHVDLESTPFLNWYG